MQFIVINHVFKEIFGRFFDKSDHLNIQRVGYLSFNACGIDLGHYIWQLRDDVIPYSPALASVIHDGLKIEVYFNQNRLDLQQFQLREDHLVMLSKLKKYLEERPENVSLDYYIDITAWIHFNYRNVKNTQIYTQFYKQGKNKVYDYLALHISRRNKKYQYNELLDVIKQLDKYDIDFMTNPQY